MSRFGGARPSADHHGRFSHLLLTSTYRAIARVSSNLDPNPRRVQDKNAIAGSEAVVIRPVGNLVITAPCILHH